MSHYYSKKQESDLRITRIQVRLRENELEFDTASGIFSIGKIDKGSELLINKCEVKNNSDVLDLGCGYGAVGISIAKAFPESKVIMTDINERAVMIAKRNVKINRVENAKVFQGDGFEKINLKFDVILFNPPQSAGKLLCISLMKKSREFLKEEGSLQVVMRHRIGGKDISGKVLHDFRNMDIITRKSGYRIYSFKI